MHRGILLYLFIAITICKSIDLRAQTAVSKTHRILIVLDGSQVMNKQMSDGRTYFSAASDFVSQLIENTYTVNPDVEFGLRVYGHQYSTNANNCNDSRMEVRFSKDNLAQVSLRMRALNPKGSGNPNYAVQQAFAQEMRDTSAYWYSIIWVSGDTSKCYTNPCTTVELVPINDLYKLYNVQISPATQKASNCFEQTFPIANTADAAGAFATIVPNYRKDKKPEPYWGGYRKKPQAETVLPKPKPAVVEKNTITINTLPATPAPKPAVIEPKRNEAVAPMKTIAARSAEMKQRGLQTVKAGGINIPLYVPPVPEAQPRETSPAINALATKSGLMNKQPERINPTKTIAPKFTPPVPEQTRDTLTPLATIGTRSTAIKQTGLPASTAKKTIIPKFTPPTPEQVRDSVAVLKSMSAQSPTLKQTTVKATPAPKAAVPGFKAPILEEPREKVTIASAGTKTDSKQLSAPGIQPKTVKTPAYTPPPPAKEAEEVGALTARSKPINTPAPPTAKAPKKAEVPEFYAMPLPQETPPPTEKAPEPDIEEVMEPDAIPAIVYGNLNVT
ncbi:MAG: VWA domain-containing protein, partial [Sphingobacteriales bacterium]